ncbi:MAG: DUF4179 domain-containing protein [Firmicutes bacterium]|nr:DUF4179 domain-containing protein [Bacillota bacterium]
MVNFEMYNEEDKLREMKSSYNDTEIPDNIEDYISKGMDRGKNYKRKKTIKKVVGYAAGLLLVICLISIRISPTFASIMSSIPGVEYIVKLINYDKGLKLAVEKEFFQHVGVSDEHEGLVFTVEDIIVDESRMIVFFSIKNKGDHKYVNLTNIDFLDEEANDIKASYGYSNFINKNMNEEKELKGKIDVSLYEELPDTITMKVNMLEERRDPDSNPVNDLEVGESSREAAKERREKNMLDSEWKVRIPINKEKFNGLKEVYSVNQKIEIGGQKIIVKQLIQHPTRIALDIEYDKDNTKEIFGFENLRIVDENEEWSTITNGITASEIDENTTRLYLQSNYFSNPSEIYIMTDGIRALDKDKVHVKIDLDKHQMINPPDDNIIFERVEEYDDGSNMTLVFGLKTKYRYGFEGIIKHYGVFNSSFTDIEGNEYRSPGEGTSISDEEYNNKMYFEIEKGCEYKNPIILEIYDYPAIIEKDIKIKVK